MGFSPYLVLGVWGGGGGSQGTGTQPAQAISTLNSLKMEVSKTDFFDIVTTHNDQTPQVKHALSPADVFFSIGCSLGKASQKTGTQLARQFPPSRDPHWLRGILTGMEVSFLDLLVVLM